MYVCILETLNLASYIATIYISIQIQPHCVRADDYARDLNSSESKSSPNVAIVGIIDAPNSDHLTWHPPWLRWHQTKLGMGCVRSLEL